MWRPGGGPAIPLPRLDGGKRVRFIGDAKTTSGPNACNTAARKHPDVLSRARQLVGRDTIEQFLMLNRSARSRQNDSKFRGGIR